jgi:hypothetical protein
MTIEWPETLPSAPLLDGFQEVLPDTALRTSMDEGPAKVRQRGTAGVGQMNVSYILSAAQAGTLADFHAQGLSGGTMRFDFPHPRTGQNVACRFRKAPTLSALNGGYYRARIELEVLP